MNQINRICRSGYYPGNYLLTAWLTQKNLGTLKKGATGYHPGNQGYHPGNHPKKCMVDAKNERQYGESGYYPGNHPKWLKSLGANF
jgi:hypothetical protein